MKRLLFILAFLFILLGFAISQAYNSTKIEEPKFPTCNLTSKCYTQTQPSPFFMKDKVTFPEGKGENFVDVSYGYSAEEYLKIGFKGENRFSFDRPGSFDRCCGSMRPTISDRAILLMLKPEEKELAIGDIVSFKCGNQSLLHRIVEVENINGTTKYLTKGDNNDQNDLIGFNCEPNFSEIYQKVVGVLY